MPLEHYLLSNLAVSCCTIITAPTNTLNPVVHVSCGGSLNHTSVLFSDELTVCNNEFIKTPFVFYPTICPEWISSLFVTEFLRGF